MSLKVHPGIGIARIGDSPTEWGIAPETIEIEPPPGAGYRDEACRLTRLGARFRVFEYGATGDPVEILVNDGTTIEWRVQLGSPTSGPLALDHASNIEVISGPSQVKVFAAVSVTVPFAFDVTYAELRTDSDGRLIVLSSPHLAPPAFQGQCSGWVLARVTRGSAVEDALQAWVVVAAPDFAPGRRPVTSYFDLLFQRSGLAAPALPSFRKDIFPILRARNSGRPLASGVESAFPLLSGAVERQTVAGIDPASPPAGEFGSGVTAVQFAILSKWIQGTPGVDFTDDWPAAATVPEQIPRTPPELDRGPLSHCLSSGSFEIAGVPSAATLSTIFLDPLLEPFRLRADAPLGSISSSIEWQGDLAVCVGLAAWAPQVESPASVGLSGGVWTTRGFMVLQDDDLQYVEACSHPYVLLLTPTLEFGSVPQGPGGTAALAHLPVVFEVAAGATDVELVLSAPLAPFSAPLGLSQTIPAGETRTVKLWITFQTGMTTDPASEAVLSVSGPDGAVYEILVHAQTAIYQPTQYVLVLDCSQSMADNRGDGDSKFHGLIAAAKKMVDLGRSEDGLGVVRFSDDVITPSVAVALLGSDRTALKASFDAFSTVGRTSIGDGLAAGRDLLAVDTSFSYAHSALVVVTDGKENEAVSIASVAGTLNAPTFALGIGMPSDVDVSTLQVLTGNLGGYLLLTGDPVGPGNYFALEKYLLQILAGVQQQDLIVDPEGVVLPGTVERVSFPVTEADLGFDAVVFTRGERLSLALRAPNGELFSEDAVSSRLPGAFVRQDQVSYFRIALPFIGSGGTPVPLGEWQLLLASEPQQFRGEQGRAGPLAAGRLAGKPVPYCATVTTRSALSFRVDVQQQDRRPGSPLLIEAVLSAFGAPWSNALVRAQLTGPGGLELELPLAAAEPGRFTGNYTPIRPGLYRLRVRAQGQTLRGLRFQRELVATAAVEPAGATGSQGSAAGCGCPEPPNEGRTPAQPGPCARAAGHLAAGLTRLARALKKVR